MYNNYTFHQGPTDLRKHMKIAFVIDEKYR